MSSLNFKQFYHIWTQQLLDWLTVKFNSIDIDTSDLAKEAKATSNKNEIIAVIPTECSNADIDHMFETITSDGLIIIPSELITPEETMPIGVFTAITGLTPAN